MHTPNDYRVSQKEQKRQANKLSLTNFWMQKTLNT